MKTKGKCGFCSKVFSGSAMARHLQSCKSRASSFQKEIPTKDPNNVFLIKVSGRGWFDYWLFIEVDGSATLENLDSFLRDIWLECCGHLSCFRIDGIRYDIKPFDDDTFLEMKNRDMKIRLNDILEPKLTFEYEYDFGSTTYLTLKVISSRQGKTNKDKIQLISRNDPPKLNCISCGKTATEICPICGWERKAWFCKNCVKRHKCGEDMALPIVNSPRTGVCGYTG